ncbi:phosphopantetheine adenylyltransferase [Haloarcula nitratireducens]|uniref:Phosphopantetheine adenylyltransferase n=1 Tax=Haloarcula nitratireducens TaxID=2487749 RepID=A0AAW4P985_9EURY|nr:pantetheine-phosphate adenylyltransferase [Halomicroarcula nitratireducens]MBX0294080.1 pantetheine-phosphate adenylyltransferase [Halomicroarcula nitratireducens]
MNDRMAILGGTFTPLHDGHRALLHSAFQTASHDGDGDGHVVVGLTSTDLATETRSDPSHAELLGPFDARRDALEETLGRVSGAYTASYEISKITDAYGPAVSREDADALIVAPEGKAHRRAHDLNDERIDRGFRPLEIHTSPFVVAEDGHRISSTRIRDGEIDRHGRLLSAESTAESDRAQ